MMTEKEAIRIFEEKKAIMYGGHFVLADEEHSEVFIDKRVIYPFRVLDDFCEAVVEKFSITVLAGTEAVVAPEKGGIILSHIFARLISEWQRKEVLGISAAKDGKEFRFDSYYEKLLAGKQVLLVDDILTSGSSLERLQAALKKLPNIKMLGAAVLWNRGGVRASKIGLDELYSLVNKKFETWSEEECEENGPCSRGVPVDIDVGHGRDFFMRGLVKGIEAGMINLFGGKKK